MEEKPLLVEPHFLPSLEYFTKLLKTNQVILETHEHYKKQSFRNRCYILTANNVSMLTVPVKEGNKKITFKEIRIDNDQNWVNIHWRTLQSAYGKSPFFEHYAPFFQKVLFREYTYLLDLNLNLLSLCLELLDIKLYLKFSEKYEDVPENDVEDIRDRIKPNKDPQMNGFYQEIRYNQIFGKNFVSNLSIIDLLFCEGGNARQILQKSTKT